MANFRAPKQATSKLAQTMAATPQTSNLTKCTFMIDKDLHRRLRLYSAEHGISMSKLINQWVKSALDMVNPEDTK